MSRTNYKSTNLAHSLSVSKKAGTITSRCVDDVTRQKLHLMCMCMCITPKHVTKNVTTNVQLLLLGVEGIRLTASVIRFSLGTVK